MYLHKHSYPSNFVFADKVECDLATIGARSVNVDLRHFEGDICRISVSSPELWGESHSQAELTPPPRVDARQQDMTHVETDGASSFRVLSASGEILLSAPVGRFFGLCGKASVFMFEREP